VCDPVRMILCFCITFLPTITQGADPNAQSLEGMTPYGYVRKRLASPPGGGATNGHSSSNGRGSVAGGSSAANQGSDCLAVTRMLQRTSEVLLELGAYKMERSALAIEQDSVTAQWMKVHATLYLCNRISNLI